MAIEVVVPQVGEVGMDVTFVGWLKQEGDPVQPGEALFEVDTEKTTLEVEAFAAGTLVDLAVKVGDVVVPRQVIARIIEPGEVRTPGEPASAERGSSSPRSAEPAPPPDPAAAPGWWAATESAPRATPRARRRAADAGIPLAGIRGTGPNGMITEADIDRALASSAPEASPGVPEQSHEGTER